MQLPFLTTEIYLEFRYISRIFVFGPIYEACMLIKKRIYFIISNIIIRNTVFLGLERERVIRANKIKYRSFLNRTLFS